MHVTIVKINIFLQSRDLTLPYHNGSLIHRMIFSQKGSIIVM